MNLADRMKLYEKSGGGSIHLTRRTPVIVRVDGRAIHTFCRSARKPFDPDIMAAMEHATRCLAREISGCVLAYVQSDEASYLLTDWANLDTEPWFAYDLQKVVSVSAATMTAFFGERYFDHTGPLTPKLHRAVFDSRAFNIPYEEIANYFLWRAQDWHRNSVTMFARSVLSHSEMQGKKVPEIHEMLHERGRNWATETTAQERNGTFVLCRGGQTEARYGVQPSFADVSDLVESALLRVVVVNPAESVKGAIE